MAEGIERCGACGESASNHLMAGHAWVTPTRTWQTLYDEALDEARAQDRTADEMRRHAAVHESMAKAARERARVIEVRHLREFGASGEGSDG